MALTSDEAIFRYKKFQPLLSFENRKEIALSIRYVSEVTESDWLIDEAFLDANKLIF